MKKYFLAIDVGASGGRHILGSIQEGKFTLEEVFRFENGMEDSGGTLIWDTEKLFKNILAGLKKCKEIGKIPESVGVDTWGVDFVLLDRDDNQIGPAIGYRDHRTDGMNEEVYKIIGKEELYSRCGIQEAAYNTVFQLMALKLNHPDELDKAAVMLMMPDYFHYRLSGKKVQEYCEATTTSLLNPKTRDWDFDLIERLGFNRKIFQKISMPGTVAGDLTFEVQENVGFNCKVVLPPTHDTASALLASPSADPDTCSISSGTWSLMGVLMDEPNCSKESMAAGFTNEGGFGGKITYVRNIMGLWIIQSVRKEMAPNISYGELCDLAESVSFPSRIDCVDDSFLSPSSMTDAIKTYCVNTGQKVPETLAEFAHVIYNSLALCYKEALAELEKITGRKYKKISIIGGGSNAAYLNQMTANATGLTVTSGPSEATAIGNILTQMMAAGVLKNADYAAKCVKASCDVEIFSPINSYQE